MDENEFDRLLKTCRLSLAPEEKAQIKKDIDNIIEYFNTLSDAKCDDYAPAYQPIKVPPRRRKDAVEHFKETGKLLKNSKIYRFFIVGPKI